MASCWYGDKGGKQEYKKQFFVRSYIVIFHIIILAALFLYKAPMNYVKYIGIFTVVWVLAALLSYVGFKETP